MQVDQELATGEFFLRESVKKRKKMEEIKVRIYGGFVSFGFLQAAFEFQCSNQALCNVAFVNFLFVGETGHRTDQEARRAEQSLHSS